LILAALAAGVAAGTRDAAGEAVKDAYAALKRLVLNKLQGRPLAAAIVDQHEQAPDVWEKPLQSELADAAAGDDEELVRAAQRVLAAADPTGATAGKYNVTISGGRGIVVGDHATVTIRFEDRE
jgi:hypothetical protein